jgi:hypothetical protein
VLTKALVEVPGVKVEGTLKPVKTEAQMVTVDLDTTKSDVGEVAKAIAASKTPHAKLVEPAAALVVAAKGIKKGDTEKVRKALADVKGVVAKESSAEEGQVIVSLNNQGGARLVEITKALKKLTD